MRSKTVADTDERPYSPGLEGVIAGETSLSRIDGERGTLLYRGYRIGDLVEHGTFPAVANLLWTDTWDPSHPHGDRARPAGRHDRAPVPARRDQADGCAAHGGVGVGREPDARLPADRRAGTGPDRRSPSALAAFARLRAGQEPIEPDPDLDLVEGFLYQLNGERPDPGTAKALDAYFVVGAEHGFNASTFTARVIMSTRSDLASAVTGRSAR